MYGYGVATVYMIEYSDAMQFQRFGTVVIAVGVLLFAQTARLIEKRAQQARDAGEPPNIVKEHLFLRTEFLAGEVFLVVMGTLQTGYGDLLHNWING
jgi:hypothetical protein